MADAITEAKGFITVTAARLGCSRRTVDNYVKDYPTVREALEDARESRHDFVESRLMAAINKDNITAIIFYLKTQCKARGYVERVQQELTGKDGGAIEVETIELTDDERAARVAALLDAARKRRDRQAVDEGLA